MTTALADRQAALAAAVQSVAGRAAVLDEQGADVRADLADLGGAGLFDAALSDSGLPHIVALIDEIATASLTVAFSTWAHVMALTYLGYGSAPLRDTHIDALRTGARIGVTAMATGLKQVAGLGQVPVIARPEDAGLTISGPIRWASNLFEDAVIVLPARDDSGTNYVVAVEAAAPGVTVDPAPDLMALGATVSSSLRFQDVNVEPDQIISTDLVGFCAGIRPAFLLAQTSFCVGVTRAALAGAGRASGVLADPFAHDLADLGERSRVMRTRLYAFAGEPARAGIADLIRLRLDAAGAALAATRLESTLVGGAGYARGNSANRRFREAAFLPVQSPSEGQLRWELSRYE
ncbi:acyl-CoA/acyl-ACP dehydrogenase [Mycolicibacterium sp. P1-5]|uniref:acyl-CoA/acyl-ACP dehydrogenase n=1 Tax=Mycolicibacterium sp. P1-5 TaxID=2024617 RepID=UPI0011EC608A|nr:acyl-CoA/acyl-ACP dehydrogenase [Mycolicibacterium sp. P1-5]KAA0112031.1 acyl-CoA dehydrogenase [Mycolicibacterium sp. P1-5]